MKTLQDIQAEQKLQESNRAKTDFLTYQWTRIRDYYPWLYNNEATFYAIHEAVGGVDVNFTLENVQLLMKDTGPQSLRARLGDRTTLKTNQKVIISRIIELLRPVRDEFGLKNEEARLSTWSLSQLEAREQEIIEKQRLQKQSPAQLRATIKPQTQAYSQFEALPETYNGVAWSAKMFSRLDAPTAKMLIRRFGADQINAAFRRTAAGGSQ